ncbi:hypothetical protein BMS3Abin02_01056 [bacterium BMS3Abin02]|nr:hypothetical protein BMS3Abin02_01056 [bacterium BMS3Abin02]GBE21338.1 hypothetical protein BMS3Bbin01_00680 [bacterium BMS3Bbin01]HDK45818.1 DUF3040 domain-containing protein [Actinomycetota bacterium]
MPLDEREQKILQEIEQGLYAEDPGLVRKVGRLSRVPSRRAMIAAIVFLLGLATTLGTFAFNQWLALGGFVTMVLAGSTFVHARRAITGTEDAAWIPRFLGGKRKRQ